MTFGTLSLLSVVGFMTETALTAVGFRAWGPLLMAIAAMLTVRLRGRVGVTRVERHPDRSSGVA